MSIKIERYGCEKCGAVYSTENEAKICEDSHIDVVKVDSVEYVQDNEKLLVNKNTRYAEKVWIRYADGNVVAYGRINSVAKNYNSNCWHKMSCKKLYLYKI